MPFHACLPVRNTHFTKLGRNPVFKDFDLADYRVRRSAPWRSSVLYEARCSLLTLAVWFAFSIVGPSDSGSGKWAAPGRENH
jgi:hypothetical protein